MAENKKKKSFGDMTIKEGAKVVGVYAAFAATLLITVAAAIIIYDKGYGDGFEDGLDQGNW